MYIRKIFKLFNIDMSDDRPIVSEDFKKLMEQKRNSNGLSGVDVCDVQDCYCKNEVVYATRYVFTLNVTNNNFCSQVFIFGKNFIKN